tara:strand:- start:33929 stop:35644 length:1716 start_codon:yes stop_codon:yes gene_type:complete
MNYILFLVVSILMLLPATSQTKESLSNLPFEAIRDSINTYLYTNTEKSLTAAKAYVLKAQQENDAENEWLGMESIALNHITARDYKNANEVAVQLLEFARINNLDKLEMRSLAFLGDLQLVVTSSEEQLRYYNELLALAEARENDEYREAALNKIANIMDLSGATEKAVAIRKQTITYYQNRPIDTSYTQKDKNSALLRSYNLLGTSYLNADQIDSAKIAVKQTKELVTKELDSCYATFHYVLDGEIAFMEARFDAARNSYKKAYAVCPSDYDIVALNKAYTFGKVEVGAENYQEAIRILQQGLDNYHVTAAEEGFMKDYYEQLAEAYKHTGDFERASYYFEKYLTTQEEYDKLKDSAKQVILADERAAFKREFDELKAEKEYGQNKLNYFLLGASLIILVLLFLLLKFYRTKKQNEAKFEALLAKINAAKTPEEIIDTKDEELEEKGSQDVSEEIKKQILEGLGKLEKKEYFLQQDCNSYNVAKKIGTNTSYLSKVINSHYGKNFNTYINDLRINYAIVRLKNDVLFRSYSIQSIAEELGYKSADSFTKYFKKDTGLNPSFYIKNIKNIA